MHINGKLANKYSMKGR